MGDFTWPVSCSGYIFANNPYEEGNHLVLASFATGEGVRTYMPMVHEPDLFLRFIKLELPDPNFSQYLEFAAQYGHLTRDVTVLTKNSNPDTWEELIRKAVKSNVSSRHPKECPEGYMKSSGSLDSEGLSDQLKYPNDPIWEIGLNARHGRNIPPESLSEWLGQPLFMRGLYTTWTRLLDAGTPAAERPRMREYLQLMLKQALSERVKPAFDTTTGLLTIVPTDLLSALWLQFAYAVSGVRMYTPCERCGQLFGRTVKGRGRRTRDDKIYCGSECREGAAYAAKKAKKKQQLPSAPPELTGGANG